MNEIRVGSLFSGIGGIELGLELAGGFKTLWFVENDAYAATILKKHWPNTPLHGDVTTLDFRDTPKVDLITGGFPCQDISNAGKRKGIRGERSSLWVYCVEALRVHRCVGFFENVAALTHRGLDTVLETLAAIGYDAEWHCVPALAVGAPHRRDRICLLAYPNGSRQQGRISLQTQSRQHLRREGIRAQRKPSPSSSKEDISHSRVEGLEGYGQPRKRAGKPPKDASEGSRGGRGYWTTEPSMGRMADGIPDWVDRIKCLGNAVVPAWAEAVGKAIKEVMGH